MATTAGQGGGISRIPSFFQETCLCSGRVSHPSLPRVGLSPGNIPRDPSLMTYCSSPHLHVASQPRKEAVPPGRPPSIPKKGPPPPAHCTSRQGFHPAVGPEGWMASVPSDPRAGRVPPTTGHQQTLLFIQCSKSQREPEKVQQRENPVQ